MPRGQVVSVEFSSAELELIAHEAAECGVTPTEFVRDAALARSAARLADGAQPGDHAEELAAIASRYAVVRSGPRFKHLT
jgi:hypothetical protein